MSAMPKYDFVVFFARKCSMNVYDIVFRYVVYFFQCMCVIECQIKSIMI